MLSSVSYIAPVSDVAAKGKAPEENSTTSQGSYLECLPTDVHKLIISYLVDPDLCVKASHLMKTMEEGTKSLAARVDPIHLDESYPDKSAATHVVQKCREAAKMIGVYRETAKKEPEFLPNPENLEPVSKLLNSYVSVFVRPKTRDRIKERQFTVVASAPGFKHPDKSGEGERFRLKLDGFNVSSIGGNKKLRINSTCLHDFGKFQDVALASGGIFFVAKNFHLEVYDLSASKLIGVPSWPPVTRLYKLDYRFDKITWDQDRMCLIGEKDGVVTELRFDSPGAEVQPTAKRDSQLRTKITYVANRVFKIIFIDAPKLVLSDSKMALTQSLLFHPISFDMLKGGRAEVGRFAIGFLTNTIAISLFPICAAPFILMGSAFATYRSLVDISREV